MPTCPQCGLEFFPEGSGWSACGDCVAAEIELGLLRELRLNPRRPMRRASPGQLQDDNSAVPAAGGDGRKVA